MRSARLRRMADGAILFFTGATAYTAIELVWRGRTHWTMAITGGTCVLLIHAANGRMKKAPLGLRCLAGCAIITLAELAVGCVVNLLLGWAVWDYSSMPLNVLGQICLPYCVCWLVMSLPCIALSTWLDSRRASAPLMFR